jgi:coenzyme F420-reducing hydrogenase gamma subunit
MSAQPTERPKLAVWKFASCDGCQLSLLDCEDELLPLCDQIVFANFAEASSTVLPPPYDLSLVEGSITTPHDAERIKEVRAQSRVLITIGACATAGGVQALRNFADVGEYTSYVYAQPSYIKTLSTSTPIAAHVRVDYELRGCPINKLQLLEVLRAFLAGRRPNLPAHSVCIECKLAGRICVALCPGYDRGCYGCYGPAESPNLRSMVAAWQERLEQPRHRIVRALRTYNAAAEVLDRAARAIEQQPPERD